ncbi:hypothetical protein CEUSTIGMA_g57.t1 [Chlamydomonas eustigma]|uniref:EF-hand domain-containing protein n=1 Tax=Chlamydomonas eustigma TaxID=1157962 RepID=A0A250WP90_9CHLO|nr:hypothetical protein CEUSTIGMA_g57.t1 [Chlamydomonas eustigma]|eukprot:GAX72601.1 hypothetical protein CEUSTIGMA_g57.t1 [Chlamydomonas eustigma]
MTIAPTKSNTNGLKNSKKLGDGSKYSKKEVKELYDFFSELDIKGTGKVTGQEILAKKNKLKLPDALSPVDFVRAMDRNHDGIVTFEELLKTLYPYASQHELKVMYRWVYPESAPEEVHIASTFEPTAEQLWELEQLFKIYDKNKSGGLEYKEVLDMALAAGYDSEEIAIMFHDADINKDEVISFDEFVQLMKSSYI